VLLQAREFAAQQRLEQFLSSAGQAHVCQHLGKRLPVLHNLADGLGQLRPQLHPYGVGHSHGLQNSAVLGAGAPVRPGEQVRSR
jgi:hypothetical protein